MRVGLVIGGIVMIIFGVLGYYKTEGGVSTCQSFLGQLGQLFSSSISGECETIVMWQIFWVIWGIVGFALTIGGIASTSQGNQTVKCSICNQRYYSHEIYLHQKEAHGL